MKGWGGEREGSFLGGCSVPALVNLVMSQNPRTTLCYWPAQISTAENVTC